MGKINREDVSNYKTGGNYFQLKDDGDSALVRFLFGTVDDMDNYIHTVHRVKVGSGKDAKEVGVDCLRADHNAPHEDCPMCAAKMPVNIKIFVPMFDEDEGKIKIWERGRTFIGELEKQFKHLPKNSDICATPFIVERSGKAGDQGTKYVLIQQAKDSDDKTLEDFDEVPEVTSPYFHILTFEEAEILLDTGELPQPAVETRSGEGKRRTARKDEERGGRDVPAETGRAHRGEERGGRGSDGVRIRRR